MVFVFLKGVTFRDSLIQGGPESGRCRQPTRSPPKEEGRFNLYQGLRAIHSTFFRGCTHTRTVSNVSKCQSQSRFRILNFPQSNIIIYILLFTLSIFYFKMSLTRLTLTRLTLILSRKSGKMQ